MIKAIKAIEALKVIPAALGRGESRRKSLRESRTESWGKTPRLTLCWAICLALCWAASAAVSGVQAAPAAGGRPNIVVVLCDDLGYGDLGCYGHPRIQTPHLDRLAREGLRLTDCYAAAANCSPARTGLMTGRTPSRVGIHNWIPVDSPMHVRRSEVTVATLLRDAGYDTCQVGKWHLNGGLLRDDQPQPSDHGFRHWFATQNNALPNHRNPFNFVRNGKAVGPLEGYAADLVADEAIRWLQSLRDPDRPFFLFVNFHEPHEPIWTDPKYERLYPGLKPSHSRHHGNITQMDAAFGRLDAALQALPGRADTLLLFTSDNGPAITARHPWGATGPLREKKGHLYEGGIRVPGIIRWPGQTRPGSESAEPVSGVDLLPTLCDVAGIQPPDRPLDGASWKPALRGQPLQRSKPLYWHFLRAASAPQLALRDGDWKLLAQLDTPPLPRGADLTAVETAAFKNSKPVRFELYNLRDDIGERHDLAPQMPDKLRQLRSTLETIYLEVRAESPVWPDWKWPRYESQKIVWPPADDEAPGE